MKKINKLMKKLQGFTLIELLATIIILAIIIMIVIPIILNVIAEAKKGAFESSAHGIVKTAENECMMNLVKGDSTIIQVSFEDGEITSEDILKFTGSSPKDGKVIINSNCKVQLAITDGFWCVQKPFNNKEITVTRLEDIDGECEITDFAGLIEWELAESGILSAILPTVTGPNVEYSLDGINWQQSRTFVDLESGALYTFRVRINGTETDDLITVQSPNVYLIDYQSGTGGVVFPTFRYVLEDTLALSPAATANQGYDFTNFMVIDGADNGTLNMMNGNVNNVKGNMTIRANFTIRQYTVNYQSNQGATFNPNYTTVPHGSSSTTPTITIDPGYTFSHYTIVSGISNGNLDTTTGNVSNVTGNMVIEASFILNEYTVSFVAGWGGVVNTESRTVNHGSDAAGPGHTANTGYTFSNYEITSGFGNATLNTTTGAVTNVIGNVTVRANFLINEYTITYQTGTGGSVTPTSTIANHGSDSAAVTPLPSTGYTFTNFTVVSGAGNGTLNMSSGVVTNAIGNMTIQANFTINTYTITYTASPGGSVTPTSRTVTHGSDAAGVTPSANTGYHFVNFERTLGSGGTLDTASGAVTNVTGNQIIRANFTINTYTVTYTTGTGGSISPSSEVVNWNLANVGPTATPSVGYHFTNFTITSGNCNGTFSNTTGICSSIREAITIRANFTINTYTVTYDGNSGTCEPTSRTVTHGANATGSSCSRTGYTINNFSITSGSCAGTFTTSTGTCSDVQANMTIRASWNINQYTVSFIAGFGGSVTPTSRLVNHGSDSAGTTPTPNTGYHFTNFTVETGAGNGTLDPSTGAVTNVTGDMTIQANFTINTYTVTYIASTGGTVNTSFRTATHGGNSLAPGYNANAGHHFVNFERTSGSGGTVNTDTGAVTNVTANQTIRANFAINTYTVTYTTSVGGTVNPASQTVNWDTANLGTIASPNTGYTYTNYTLESGSCNGTFNGATGICSSVRESITVRANFTINSYTVNYQSNQGATFNPTFITVTHGGSASTPSVTVEPGYTFSHYTTVSGVSNGTLNTTTGNVTNVIGNMTIEASFTLNEYTVSYIASTGGVVNTASRVVNHGANSAAPGHAANTGYTFSNFEITSGGGNGTLTPSTGAVTDVIGNMTVRANFTINTYTVTYTASSGGSVTPSSQTVNWDIANISPTATPNAGYTLTNFTLESGTCSGTFTPLTGVCSSVRQAITVRANFTINTYTVTYDSNSGTCTPTSRTVNWGASAAGPTCSRTGHTLSNYSITSGSCAGTFTAGTGACSDVRANMTIKANYTINQYTVTYTASTGGSVTPTSELINWNLANNGTAATPSTGYTFANYTIASGSCNGTFNNTTGVCSSVIAAMTIQANFLINTYTVSYTASTGGTVSTSSRVVAHGNTSDAPGHTPNTGYNLVNFERTSGSGGTLSTTNGAVTNVTGNQTIRANFALIQYTLTYTAGTGGTVTPSSETVNWNASSVGPSATPSANYVFSNYLITSGGCYGTFNSSSGICSSVREAMTIQANFTLNAFTVTYDGNGGTCTPTSRSVISGATSAAPSCTRTGYTLSGFTRTLGSGGTLNTTTGEVTNVTGNQTIRANWTINQFTVTYDGSGGTCTPTSRTVDYNTTSAAPSCSRSGYNLTGFTRTSGSGGTLNTSTGAVTNVTGNQTIRANWTSSTSYTVTYSAGSNGSVSPTSRIVSHGGTSDAPTITPASCNRVGSIWISSGSGNGTLNASTGAVTNVTGSLTVSISFVASGEWWCLW